ncbi:MAG: hypothetical protein ACYTGC_07675, partial [Planctomycetota bacterium]
TESTGDGDGDGSGDGDTSTTGDGDDDTSTTGDGDGDTSTTGDGDAGCVDPPPFPPAATPDDGYQRFSLCGWTVYMADALWGDDLADDVYDSLAGDLAVIIAELPADAIGPLEQTNMWFELSLQDFPGGVYHPSAQWLEQNGYPTKWAEGIQFGVAQNFLSWRNSQPAMVLHEMSHAWDHKQHGFNHPAVTAAYEAAMAAGLYESAYASTNATEYFAELSEAYYWENDFYPYVNDELASYDPQGLAAIESAWGL